MAWDALILSRLQFAFVVSFHILFPAFTIGLASYLAVLEGAWLATRRERFRTLYLFWLKIFALSFAMGVVSGVVMSYQFGTNWSVFSRDAGSVIGPLMAYEVLTAFFLEASFLGVMLFGWRKVGPGLHFLATCLVALGTLTSAFWIMAANSWMQTPAGFARDAAGRLAATDYWQVVFNPSFPSRFVHMVLAAYLTTGLVVAAASAMHLLRHKADPASQPESRLALRMAIGLLAVVAPLQLVAGHETGRYVLERQPLKLAAIEAYWTTRADQPMHLFGAPDRRAAATHMEVAVPGIGNLVQGLPRDAVIRGLDAFPRKDWPIVFITFWSFRLMVGLGLAMIGLGVWGAWLWLRGRLDRARWFQRACVAMGPAGFASVVLGWITAEVGRQPYTVYGVLRTAQSVSPVPAAHVAASLLAFLVIYAVVFTAGALYILRLVWEGPQAAPTDASGGAPRPPGHAGGAAPGRPEHGALTRGAAE